MSLLYRFAGTRPGHFLLSFILPVERLAETETLLAFHHPKPAYPFHVVIVPKASIASLETLDPADSSFLTDLYTTVQMLVKKNDLANTGYRLIVNGGKYQDFPHLHFHLISEAWARPSRP
jgi:histidine triad (HIT) family protein